MSTALRRLTRRIRRVFASAIFLLTSCSLPPSQQPGHIVGHIDGISRDGDHYLLSGWACQRGLMQSIKIQLFANAGADSVAGMAPVLTETADLFSEPGVAQACRTSVAGKHRFVLVLPYGYGPNSILAVHGLRIVDGVPNDAIAGSGTKLPVLAAPAVPYAPLPRPTGAYSSLAMHPGVFMTPKEVKDIASRIDRPNSYSRHRFDLLAAKIAQDLKSGIDWDVTYSGGDPSVYQYSFSYEPQDGHDAQTRAALNVPSGIKAPAGAAVVASRLALYAALVNAGAVPPPGAPGAAEPAALAKRILLAWADRGFRDPSGRFQSLGSFVRDGRARPQSGLGLTLGRGVIYSVQAQDLLESLGMFDSDEIRRLNAANEALFELIRQSENVLFAGVGYPYSACSRYTNLAANANVGMLATARLLNDSRKVEAVVFGGDPSLPVLAPWTQLFDRLVYGQSDGPDPACVENREADSESSLLHHDAYQTPRAAPGEIADRFRNATPLQGIGYPMFTLERLLDGAELLRFAGFDVYDYRGRRGQSIELAVQYYACFAKRAGFYGVVSAANASDCPNAGQYYGKLVNGVDTNILIAAYRFPNDPIIRDVLAAAQSHASAGAFSDDAILFGKWPD
ncbi:hypothetical protein AB1286_32575 [Trinickia sp. NRRL B-1857]|uniref:hypothetical protein n=1 Tax=Trinickia sp. NRRL B-1857 TaxID=3162879 RepID=UPI003D2AAFBB